MSVEGRERKEMNDEDVESIDSSLSSPSQSSLPGDLSGLVGQLLVSHAADDDLVLFFFVREGREKERKERPIERTNSNTII